MDDRIDEILRRLEALEGRLDELSRGQGSERSREAECCFRGEERRIVDLIVRLTAERVEQALEARSAEGPPDGYRGPPQHCPPQHGPAHYGPPPPGHHHGGPPPGPPPSRGPRRW